MNTKKEIKNTIVTPKSNVLLKVVSKEEGSVARISPHFFNTLCDDYGRFVTLCHFFRRYCCDVYLGGCSVRNGLYYDAMPTDDIDIIVVGKSEDLKGMVGFFINPVSFEIENFSYENVTFQVNPNSTFWKNRANPNFAFDEKIRLVSINPCIAPNSRQFDISFVTPEVFEKTLG